MNCKYFVNNKCEKNKICSPECQDKLDEKKCYLILEILNRLVKEEES